MITIARTLHHIREINIWIAYRTYFFFWDLHFTLWFLAPSRNLFIPFHYRTFNSPLSIYPVISFPYDLLWRSFLSSLCIIRSYFILVMSFILRFHVSITLPYLLLNLVCIHAPNYCHNSYVLIPHSLLSWFPVTSPDVDVLHHIFTFLSSYDCHTQLRFLSECTVNTYFCVISIYFRTIYIPDNIVTLWHISSRVI